MPDVFTKAERSDVMSRIRWRARWEHERACTAATFRSAAWRRPEARPRPWSFAGLVAARLVAPFGGAPGGARSRAPGFLAPDFGAAGLGRRERAGRLGDRCFLGFHDVTVWPLPKGHNSSLANCCARLARIQDGTGPGPRGIARRYSAGNSRAAVLIRD